MEDIYGKIYTQITSWKLNYQQRQDTSMVRILKCKL